LQRACAAWNRKCTPTRGNAAPEPRPTPPLSLRRPINPINPVPLTFKLQPLTGRRAAPRRSPTLLQPPRRPSAARSVAAQARLPGKFPLRPKDAHVPPEGEKRVPRRATMTTWITRFIAFRREWMLMQCRVFDNRSRPSFFLHLLSLSHVS